MASLWKHPNSRFWTACFTDQFGRQRKVSTKRTNRNEAMVIAQNLEHAESQARDSLITESRCRDILSDILQKASGKVIHHPTIRQHLKSWLDGKSISAKASSYDRYRGTIDRFLESLAARADRPLASLTTEVIEAFVKQRKESGIAPYTIRVDIKTLNAPFLKAQRMGLIQVNPVANVERPRGGSSKRKTFDHEQVSAILKHAPADWTTVILFGVYVGARLTDCANMKWSFVNLKQRTLTFTPEKTDEQVESPEPIIVPLHPILCANLEKLAARGTQAEYVTPSLAGLDTKGRNGLSARFKAIMDTAGVSTETVQGKGIRKFSKLSFHSLRHGFNSQLANAGVPQEWRMRLTGQTTVAVNDRYTHPEVEKLREAIHKLPTFQSAAKS